MTPLIPTRRAAEEFAQVLDGTREDTAHRYADLLECVGAMRSQEIPAARPEFVADLRSRLMDAADTLLIPAERPLAPVVPISSPTARRQRRISIAAAALVVVGGTAGVAAAAENSLPGDPLYPLKRGIESAQVTLNASDSGKGQDLLRQAGTRLDEVSSMISAHDSATNINNALSAFQDSASNGADLLFVSYQRTGDPQDLTRLRAMLSSQLGTMDRLAPTAPASTQASFASARALALSLDRQAQVLCGSCGDQSAPNRFTSSAPALISLLNQPINAASQAAAAASTSSLAERADEIAKHTPKAPTGLPTTAPGLPTPSGSPTTSPSLPPVPNVSDVTGGVKTLLDQVDQATGGTTKPLTDTLTQTLNTLGGLLP